jgi:hypothetical protein
MDYPKMIYLGGDVSAEYRIVDDEHELAAAAKDGFVPHDHKAKAAHKDLAPPADPTPNPAELAAAAPVSDAPAAQKNKGGRPKKGG